MLTEQQIQNRDAERDIGAELLAAIQEMNAGLWASKTTFEALADGRIKRCVIYADGSPEKQEIFEGPQWQLLSARAQSGLSQLAFARAAGVSVRTLQEWEQGRKKPNGTAQSLLKLISRHPELLAELL